MATTSKRPLAEAVRAAFGCAYPRSTGGHEACGVTDERIAAILAGAGASPHRPGDPHEYRLECKVCGALGQIRVSVDPQVSE